RDRAEGAQPARRRLRRVRRRWPAPRVRPRGLRAARLEIVMHRYITNIAALLLAVVLPAAFAADNAQDAENRIKAAFLYHFCNYVQWPESAFAAPGDELVIGVAGPEAIVQAVDAAVSQRAANGHPMRVRRVSSGDQLDG